jgi:type I site-specific restriction-modification system R (restriction) subunit
MAAQKIDITIVVDMLLTGFDSKNLNLHGLIISGPLAYEQ